MANNETNTEQNNKIQIGARIDPNVAAVIDQIAKDEERTISWVVDRLLLTHPRIQPMLETEPATTGATA